MKKRHEAPASVWTEEELLDGNRVRCLTIILSTPGCAWWRNSGGCSMCGYNEKASDRSITGENILAQFESAWKSFDNQSIIKVYTSGSFIDESEIPSNVREEILNRVKGSGAKMLFESRPEFVEPETVKECIEVCPDIEIALGLESANDQIRSKSIHKGFAFSDYELAAKNVLSAGATVRTYILLKPPFLTEQEAIDDTVQSISKAAPYSRVITVNPVNVQRRTRLEKLWKNWAYRPPWLWSVIEVLKRAEAGDSLLLSSMVGAGSGHGPHNCGTCDSDFISSIDGFNLTQDRKKLERCDCGCRSRWQEALSIEKFAIAPGDHEKFYSR